MRGRDGIVMASDRREWLSPQQLAGDEGSGSATNMLTKIRLDSSGQFAWAFAGGKNSHFAASCLEREFEKGIPDDALERTLRDCCDRGWKQDLPGPSSSTVILVDGANKNIWRA